MFSLGAQEFIFLTGSNAWFPSAPRNFSTLEPRSEPCRYPQVVTSTGTLDAFAARSWPIRLLRSLAASSISVLLAVGGHRLGGGEVVSPLILGAVSTTVLAVAFQLAGRKVTMGQIIGLLLIGQILVHAGCMAGAEPMSSGPAMLVAHLLATAVTTAALSKGEQLLWTLAECLGLRRMRLLLARVATISEDPSEPASYDFRLSRLDVLVGGPGLRGPPVGIA